MDKQLELKNKLKDWEKAFSSINGKKPTKADVDVAPTEIRNLYIEFWKLKKRTSADSGYGSGNEQQHQGTTTTTFRLKRDGSFSDQLIPKRSSGIHLTRVVQQEAGTSLSNVDENKQISKAEKSENLRLILESIRKDKTFLFEPFAAIRTNFQNNLFGTNSSSSNVIPFPMLDIDEDSLCHLPDEIDFRKRQNLCKFSFACDELEQQNAVSNNDSSIMTDEGNENLDQSESVCMITNQIMFCDRKKRKRLKLNENFVKLDLKHKKFASRAGKKLKGAALKRLLLKKKYKKLRKSS